MKVSRSPDAGCSRLLHSGRKHFTYRDYRTVLSAARCASECLATSYCRTFSYRYGATDAADVGNCLLSDRADPGSDDMLLVPVAGGPGGRWDVFQVRKEPEPNTKEFVNDMVLYLQALEGGGDGGGGCEGGGQVDREGGLEEVVLLR